MKMVNIPHFKQVVIMSTVCDDCGYRSNEVKTGGEVPEKGRRITLKVRTKEDLLRDILKSESAVLLCPELQLRVEPGTMGGRFTTVEGILTQIRRDLRSQAFGLEDGDADVSANGGDSMMEESKRTWDSFFQSQTAPDPDPQIEVEDYVRTEQEAEELGLNDMKTEGYHEQQDSTEPAQ
jgi:zinc finger protein